ncbi:MAG: LysM peptidoglycan-binding domain-containing protein [Oscillospiraceae bacterium]|nr:LysM peptidoglycan-binding domain-containing protein [Oscillospiraceae bacterium]
MRTGKRFWSLLLALVLVVSLMGGAFVAGAVEEAGPYEKAASLDKGSEYLIATEYEGKTFALTCVDSVLGAMEIAVDGDAVAAADNTALWVPDGSNHLESKTNPGKFIFAGSGGFMVWDSSMLRDFVYDAASETVKLHTKYWLTFDGAKFDQTEDQAKACKVLLYAKAGAAAAEPAEEAPAMSIFDYPHPETVRRSAVKNADGSITLAFSSDTHYDGANLNLKTWMEASEAEVGYIDAMGFCGDMGSAYASTADEFWSYAGATMAYVDSRIADGKVGDAIYTTGNHEWFPYAGGNYSAEYDNYDAAKRLQIFGEGLVTDDYIIYCFGAGESAVGFVYEYRQDEIDAFAAYLETAPTDIPIFVLTHYPLHRWLGRGEERYQKNAAEIIDLLNDHPNLVVLWGHNHSDFDDNYYAPKFPGDEIVISPEGETKTINFTYLAAGCTADTEYTGPSAGSASVMNKGLIVTIKADGTMDYNYVTIDGQLMHIDGPWLVRFRGGFDNYEVFDSQYVDNGQTPAPVEAPAVDGYAFDGWYTWNNGAEAAFDFAAPITRNILVTAKYAKVLAPVAAPNAADCVTVKPSAAFNGQSLTMTAAGVGDRITVFDLASIGYGTGIEYGFWFAPDGVVSFDKDATLYYQGSPTDFTLKAGEFYSVAGLGEHYLQLDDGSMLLLLENEAPGNFASLPGDQPFSAFPGTAGAAEPAPAEPAPAPASEPAPAAGQTYTVVPGDNLWKIAQKFYGTGFKWDVIYKANAASIRNPSLIYAGQVLQIP